MINEKKLRHFHVRLNLLLVGLYFKLFNSVPDPLTYIMSDQKCMFLF